MSEWISVNDRLPEDDLPSNRKVVKVLTYSSNGLIRTETRMKEKHYHDKEWSWGRGHRVTHWMPLQEPPEVEDGNT